MLSLPDPHQPRAGRLSRRDWLHVGSLALGGLTWPGLLAARAAAAADPSPSRRPRGSARAVILFGLLGGPPQHETWDPKPDAPEDIRGPFKPIATSVPGLKVGELMPRVARLAHHCAVLRAVATGDNAHSSSGYYMLTGRPHAPLNVENARPGAPNDAPCLAALANKFLPRDGAIPPAVVLPDHIWNDGNIPWPGQDAGWLGRAADPWVLHCDPTQPDYQLPELGLPADVPPARVDARRTLLGQVAARLDTIARGPLPDHFDDLHQRAFDLLRSPRSRLAFDLGREPDRVRDRYGRSRFGQSCLLARRLVEAGVPLVQVNWTRIDGAPNQGGWDTHAKNAESLKSVLMPIMDQAYSALLEDLADRGLLSSTLVAWMGEFGRTPRHNGAGGRDHWGHVFSVALSGGGVKGGVVHGASDRIGAQPRDGKVLPEDLTATILSLLGIRPELEVQDPLGRVFPLSRGQVLHSILA